MDFILLGFLLLFCIIGYFRGFLISFLSLFSGGFAFFLAYKFCGSFAHLLFSGFGKDLTIFLQSLFDKSLPGEFDATQFFDVFPQKFPLFSVLLNFVSNLSFEGTLSVGQIVSHPLSMLVLKVISFIILFVCISLLFKIIKLFAKKITKKCGVSNRLLGVLLGLAKGLFLFGIVYASLIFLSNILLSESLIMFVKKAKISSFLYENIINRIFSLF